MNIYSKKQKWKLSLLGFAIVIAISSLFITNSLVTELKKEERKKIELWAFSIKQLNNINIGEECNYSLSIKVITDNDNIPVILVDECDSILEFRNLNMNTDNLSNSSLRKELSIMKGQHEPITIDILGNKQLLYYKDSTLLSRLRYYPFFQLGFIGLFIFIAYLVFNASRKSEQNQVWAGMAKETAHQIGTPLSSLMAWIELLKEKAGTESMVLEMSKDIKRLETITDRFSKIGSKSELQQADIVALIRQSIEYLKSRMSVNALFTLDFPNKKIMIPLNTTLFEWVIENLCKNAVDAMKGKGEIRVSITEDSNNVIINITDNGEGIDRSILKNIFKPGVTSKKRGWGLGLSLSKRIIEEYHKGSLFLMQTEQGVGTSFTIRLPKDLHSTTT